MGVHREAQYWPNQKCCKPINLCYPSALPSTDPRKDKEQNLNGISVPLVGDKVEQTGTSWCLCEELTVSVAGASLFV